MLLVNPLVDIHTHREDELGVVSVKSLELKEIQQLKSSSFSSVGLHPWWLEELDQNEISQIKISILQMIDAGLVKAIGEAGIDRSLEIEVKDQINYFEWHIELSEKYQLPLYIHSVRAGSDILGMIKIMKPTMPWIFHDFRGSEELMLDLLRLHPQSYFSFGLSVDNSQKIRDLLPLVPLSQLFLETDAQKHLSIHEIYLRASHFIGIDPDFLKSQIYFNFKKVFNL